MKVTKMIFATAAMILTMASANEFKVGSKARVTQNIIQVDGTIGVASGTIVKVERVNDIENNVDVIDGKREYTLPKWKLEPFLESKKASVNKKVNRGPVTTKPKRNRPQLVARWAQPKRVRDVIPADVSIVINNLCTSKKFEVGEKVTLMSKINKLKNFYYVKGTKKQCGAVKKEWVDFLPLSFEEGKRVYWKTSVEPMWNGATYIPEKTLLCSGKIKSVEKKFVTVTNDTPLGLGLAELKKIYTGKKLTDGCGQEFYYDEGTTVRVVGRHRDNVNVRVMNDRYLNGDIITIPSKDLRGLTYGNTPIRVAQEALRLTKDASRRAKRHLHYQAKHEKTLADIAVGLDLVR